MPLELTVIEDHQHELMKQVVEAATEGALEQIADCIAAAIEQLRSLQSQIAHSSGTTPLAAGHGRNLAEGLIDSLIDDLPLNAVDVVGQLDLEDRLANAEYAASQVRGDVIERLKGLRY